MAVSLAHLPLWLWGGKRKGGGKGVDPAPSGSSSSEWGIGLRDLDNVRFPLVKGSKMASPSSRKVKRKWKSREERRRIEREFDDVVLVPSDGGCLSGSESDDSDWSIGWLEPHAPDFRNDDEADNSFAVLVPCYRHNEIMELEARPANPPPPHHHHHHHKFLDGINFLQTGYSDGKKHVEEWISSLQSY